jgi:lysozyme family protein
MNFDTAFDRLLGHEGGYVDDPKDLGGETNWGISKRSYPSLDIKNLTREQARAIYQRDFWYRGRMDYYDGAIAFQAFDAAVNHGIETAIRLLQRAAGVADDGFVGPVTIQAIKAKTVTDMLMLFIAERIEFWTRVSTWETHGKGWARRAAKDLRFAAEDS